MKTWKIPVTWEVCGIIEIEAETVEEAIKEFDRVEDEDGGWELPYESYVDGSFERESEDFIKELNNKV